MIICVCNRVSDKDIQEAVYEGCCSMRQLQEQTCLATQCGRCYEQGCQVLKAALRQQGQIPAAEYDTGFAPTTQI